MESHNLKQGEQVIVTGKIDRKRFYKADNGFGIVEFKIDDKYIDMYKLDEIIVLKGIIGSFKVGDRYRAVVSPDKPHAVYGVSYNIESIGLDNQMTRDEYVRCVLSERNYELLSRELDSSDIYKALEERDYETLMTVKGIGKKTSEKICDDFIQKLDTSDIFITLKKMMFTDTTTKKIIDSFENKRYLFQILKTNPYKIIEHVSGISFKTMDEHVVRSGMKVDIKLRIEAFTNWFLGEKAYNGDSYIDVKKELIPAIVETIKDIEKEDTKKILDIIYNYKYVKLSNDKSKIYLKYVLDLESEIAEHLIRIRDSDEDLGLDYSNWEESIKRTEENQGYEFTEEQLEGIKRVKDSNITVITGLAGTGKSTVVRAIFDMVKEQLSYDDYAQTALSGRASAKLFEVTGSEGITIHRLLGYDKRGFNAGMLEQKMIVLDEASMVDAKLFRELISRVRDGCKLIIMGDVGQLEPIGMGNILHDIIKSGVIPTVSLTQIHRQGMKSAIITVARAVREGKQIVKAEQQGSQVLGELQDLKLSVSIEADRIVTRAMEEIDSAYKECGNIFDVQCISPLNSRGTVCNDTFNKLIQHKFNPECSSKNQVQVGTKGNTFYTLREGDKVMCVKNNYGIEGYYGETTSEKYFKKLKDNGLSDDEEESNEIDIFNGNFGEVLNIIEKPNGKFKTYTVIIHFFGIGVAVIPNDKLFDIKLGYSASVHKLQGDERDYVVFAFDNASYPLHSRELLYTGITRAKKYCSIVTQNSAFRRCVAQTFVRAKRTFLAMALQSASKSKEGKVIA